MERTEILTRGEGPPSIEPAPGVRVRLMATGAFGTKGLTTALASFEPGAELPYHVHPFGEVIILLEGDAEVLVEGRKYRVAPYDAVILPTGTAHRVRNLANDRRALFHSSWPADAPKRDDISAEFPIVDRERPSGSDPEKVIRLAEAPVYELAANAQFRDLFAKRLGSSGICGGYGRFAPGSSLPCHFHGYDESITIVEGRAVCQVAGKEYSVGDYDSVSVPTGRPHRFLNRSDAPMAMIWVYAGDEPDRVIVDAGLCSR